LAGHTTSPTTVDWDRDGVRDLLVGAEDGRFYYQKQKHVDPMRIESFLIEGRGFEVATLDNGQSAYGNREYTWFDVTDELQGGQVTRTSGRHPSHGRRDHDAAHGKGGRPEGRFPGGLEKGGRNGIWVF
jgi:hypothetical protein